MNSLQQKGLLDREGGKRNGSWILLMPEGEKKCKKITR